jgi:hypothetical protein
MGTELVKDFLFNGTDIKTAFPAKRPDIFGNCWWAVVGTLYGK